MGYDKIDWKKKALHDYEKALAIARSIRHVVHQALTLKSVRPNNCSLSLSICSTRSLFVITLSYGFHDINSSLTMYKALQRKD